MADETKPVQVKQEPIDDSNMSDLTSLIQGVLQQTQDRFQHMSDQIIRPICCSRIRSNSRLPRTEGVLSSANPSTSSLLSAHSLPIMHADRTNPFFYLFRINAFSSYVAVVSQCSLLVGCTAPPLHRIYNMGADNSKAPRGIRNIEAADAVAFIKRFKTETNGKDKMNKEQFLKTYPIFRDYGPKLFFQLLNNEPQVSLSTWLKTIDQAMGHFDTLAAVLHRCFGEDKNVIIGNVVKIYCAELEMSRQEQVLLFDYFDQQVSDELKKPEQIERFLSACPLFAYIALFIFQRVLEKPGDSKIPVLSEKSAIFGTIDSLIINSHLPFDRRKEWTLLYSNQTMGHSFSQMVKRVNGEGPVLVVIRSEKKIRFGFFASAGVHAGPQYQGSAECFLFQLHPKLVTYSATGRTDNYAYLNYQQQTLPNGMGLSGRDDIWPLFIREEFDSGTCQKNSSFYEPCFVAEAEEFKIKTIEVWRPGNKPQKTFEEQVEMAEKSEKSVIDKDPEARAVLEMAGKSMHSEAYREPAPLLSDE
ncbi:unnamed protein product [Caenorhabditis sp. 36 PRJEB53466]|nr:unnamed protein product [Caenorhabditis sp. 36 PRJEB53466]